MKRKSIEIKTVRVEIVTFREFADIMKVVRNYSVANDVTVSQVMRKALREFLRGEKGAA
jgi:hypothetical protein